MERAARVVYGLHFFGVMLISKNVSSAVFSSKNFVFCIKFLAIEILNFLYVFYLLNIIIYYV